MTAEILHIRDWQSPEEREVKPCSGTLHLIDPTTGIEISRHSIGVDGRIPADLCASIGLSGCCAPDDGDAA